jgi:hypothetical protein
LSVGLFVCALAKKWLFWFFERWLECRKKPNVPFAGRLFTLSDNVIRLEAVANFGNVNFQLLLNFLRKIKVIEPHIFPFLETAVLVAQLLQI